MARDILVQKSVLVEILWWRNSVTSRDIRDFDRTILPNCIFVTLSLTEETQVWTYVLKTHPIIYLSSKYIVSMEIKILQERNAFERIREFRDAGPSSKNWGRGTVC